ncbi:MAG TPA: HNH endonuclease, partial [Methanomicrobiales archaeon]|nr:HNH endonuclease [Methanomicrobiales archaeon]
SMPNFHARIPSSKLQRIPSPGVTIPKANPPAPRSFTGEGDREKITPEIQAKVWKKRFGFRKTGTCVCCHQRTIYRDDFVCGHRRTYAGGGSNDVSNLEPICGECHEKMGTQDLVSWCKKYREELNSVKPMPKTTTAKKPVRKMTAKKPVRKTAAKRPASRTAAAKKTVRKTTSRKPAAKKSKR